MTNCLLYRCNSESVMFRAGSVIFSLKVADMGSIVGPPREEDACEDIIEETIDVVVCSNV